jgi:hypothetical protein
MSQKNIDPAAVARCRAKEVLPIAKGAASISPNAGADNQAIVECHIVGLIHLPPLEVPDDNFNYLVILDGFPVPWWIWCDMHQLVNYPEFLRLLPNEGRDFEPITRNEWVEIICQAFAQRLGCWDATEVRS